MSAILLIMNMLQLFVWTYVMNQSVLLEFQWVQLYIDVVVLYMYVDWLLLYLLNTILVFWPVIKRN